jgi:hypothetical protein
MVDPNRVKGNKY